MRVPLFRATVICSLKGDGKSRTRAGRTFSAGQQVVEDLTQAEIDALQKDVILSGVSSEQRKNAEFMQSLDLNKLPANIKIVHRFFIVTEIEPTGAEKDVPDTKPAVQEIPQDRLPSAPELLGYLHEFRRRLDRAEEENHALKQELAALKSAPVVEPASSPELFSDAEPKAKPAPAKQPK